MQAGHTFLLVDSCQVNLRWWPQVSLGERKRVLMANSAAVPEEQSPLHPVAGESCLWTKNRGGREQGRKGRMPSLVTNLENAHLGHFCWLEWQLMKIR